MPSSSSTPPPPTLLTLAGATAGWLVPGGMWLINISECHLQYWVVGFSAQAAQGCVHASQPITVSCCHCHLSSSSQLVVGSLRGVSAPGPAPSRSHYTTVGLSHTHEPKQHTPCLTPSITTSLQPSIKPVAVSRGLDAHSHQYTLIRMFFFYICQMGLSN